MDCYAGILVPLEQSSICVLDGSGKVRETKVASEPEALSRYSSGFELPVARIGLETGPSSQLLPEGLVVRGGDAMLLETRHVA